MRVLDILLTRGVMVRAVTTRLADIDLRGLVPRVMVSPRDLEGPQFSLSPSSATTMEVSPLLQDPYEAQRVCVRQSTVAGKRGENSSPCQSICYFIFHSSIIYTE